MGDRKNTNPKDRVGSRKPRITTIPAQVLFEIGNALFEGHLKYGGNNWRASGVQASVYFDAAFRHLSAWWTGENTDPDSGMSHISKAIAGLVILRDAMLHDMVNDDRPPASPPGWLDKANEHTKELLERYPVAEMPIMESNRAEWEEALAPPRGKYVHTPREGYAAKLMAGGPTRVEPNPHTDPHGTGE